MEIYIIGVLVLGVFVGIVSGMFGIGGAGIIIPSLLLLLPFADIPHSELMFMAMGTSFATMIVSTASTAYNQYRHNNVVFSQLKLFLPILLITVYCTSHFITSIDQSYLKLFFSCFLVYIGSKMYLQSKKTIHQKNDDASYPKSKTFLSAALIGVISTLGGASGAGLIISYLNKTGLDMKKSVGTAAFCGVFLTLIATSGFAVGGLSSPHETAYSFGFIHIPTVILISITSIPMTKVGVKLLLKTSDNNIKRNFGLFLLTISAIMIFVSIKSLLN